MQKLSNIVSEVSIEFAGCFCHTVVKIEGVILDHF